MKVCEICDNSFIKGRISAEPKEQFKPIESKFGVFSTEMQNASSVCPVSVLPLLSLIVTESIIGSDKFFSFNT